MNFDKRKVAYWEAHIEMVATQKRYHDAVAKGANEVILRQLYLRRCRAEDKFYAAQMALGI